MEPTVNEIAAQIASDCDGDYSDGPCDGAEACSDANEFADYWLDGDAGDQVTQKAQALGIDQQDLWAATRLALMGLYDPERHGSDEDADS